MNFIAISVLILIRRSMAASLNKSRSDEQMTQLQFQSDGFHTTDSYLSLSNTSQMDLGFSLCFWYSVDYWRGGISCMVSIIKDEWWDLLGINLVNNQTFNGNVRLEAVIDNVRSGGVLDKMYEFRLHQWYSWCGVNKKNEDGSFTLMSYSNGKNATIHPGVAIPEGSIIVLAQEQDSPGGSFELEQSFAGKLAKVQLWPNAILTSEEVHQYQKCEPIRAQNATTSFIPIEDWISRNVRHNLMPQNELCMANPWVTQVLLPEQILFKGARSACQLIGTDITTINSTLEEYDLRVTALFRDLCRENVSKNCREISDLPVNPVFTWVLRNTTTGECDRLYGAKKFSDRVCENSFGPSTLCVSLDPENNEIFLKGLCQDSIYRAFDTSYQVYKFGTKGRMRFHGIQKSRIEYLEFKTSGTTEKEWRIQSLSFPEEFFTLKSSDHQFPFGRRIWTVGGEHICSLATGSNITLTFARCTKSQFTCDDGKCIDLIHKCDGTIDCQDKSDELNCKIIQPDDTYIKELVPMSSKGTTEIEIQVKIFSIRNVEPMESKITFHFKAVFTWSDSRLKLADLSMDMSRNVLSHEDMAMIWIPQIILVNTLSPGQSHRLETDIGKAQALNAGKWTNITEATEAIVFEGESSKIKLERDVLQEFQCNFDLQFYPFDAQTCSVVFQIKEKDLDSLRFQICDELQVLDDIYLTEYDIIRYNLNTSISVTNHSRAIASVTIRRKMAYHVFNTFFQTLLLIFVGYLSFFFKVENFSDRIMVTLTTMLVVATIMVAIQSGLPKTSYYKMIDYWLIFCLIILIITFAIHTAIGFILDQPEKSGQTPSQTLLIAQRMNRLGRVFVAAIVVIFNLGFWILAFDEYVQG